MPLRLIAVLAAVLFTSCGQPVPEPLPDYGKVLPKTATFVSARNFASRGLLWLSNSPSGIQFSAKVPEALASEPVVTVRLAVGGSRPRYAKGPNATY
jgi:hypothetical protein